MAMLVESLPENSTTTKYFDYWRSLFVGFDVFHVHWPESLLRHPNFLGRLAKLLFLSAFLVRVAVQRKPIVRTVHNVQPHESLGSIERLLVGVIDRLTTQWIVLNETTVTPNADRTSLIRHGHYRDWYDADSSAQPLRGRILAFGLIRPYKGFDTLIESVRRIPRCLDYTLSVCGNPSSEKARAHIESAADGDGRISLDLRFLPDQELADEVVRSEVVVLPYDRLHNSGAVLLALSLNRPVVVPDGASTRLLVEEFGPEWVVLFSSPLTSDSLLSSLRSVRGYEGKRESPDMSMREWPYLGSRLADVYREVVADSCGREAGARPATVRNNDPASA